MTINEIQDELIEEFSLFGDWMEKYENYHTDGKRNYHSLKKGIKQMKT